MIRLLKLKLKNSYKMWRTDDTAIIAKTLESGKMWRTDDMAIIAKTQEELKDMANR